MSWMIFVVDVALIAFLSFRAYQDGKDVPLPYVQGSGADEALANTLDRFEVPFFGPLASSFVDSE